MAWTTDIGGGCLLVDRPGFFLALFPLSAGFWWSFEYLNRFVQNWYYLGVDFTPWQYFWYATLPFSTVLPAVLSTRQWLHHHLVRHIRVDAAPTDAKSRNRTVGWLILMPSAMGLAAIGIRPNYLFPLLWVSPLLIIVSLQSVMGEDHIFSGLDSDRGISLLSAALAALVCGFFWEMWNSCSLAKWAYSIPFVHRFLIFEMPALGYVGYLPFGLMCAAVGEVVSRGGAGTAVPRLDAEKG